MVKKFACLILLLGMAYRAPAETSDTQPFVAGPVRPSCEAELGGARDAYLTLLKIADDIEIDGQPLMGEDARTRLRKGEVVDVTAGKPLHAHTVALAQAFSVLTPLLAQDQELAGLLQNGGFEKAILAGSTSELRSNGKKLFAPHEIATFPTSLNHSQTYYYWYRSPKGEAMLAIRQRQGLNYHVINASTREMVAERNLDPQASTPEIPQSPFFTEQGMLSTAYADVKNHRLVLYNILEDKKSSLPLLIPGSIDEIRPVILNGANYIVVTSRDGFEVFKVEDNALQSVRMIPIPAPLYDHQVLVTEQGRLQVWARDSRSVYMFEPLTHAQPLRVCKCGDEAKGEWLTKLTASLGPGGRPIAVAVSQHSGASGSTGGLHILSDQTTLERHVDLDLKDGSPQILLRNIRREGQSEELLLSVLQGSELRILNPLSLDPGRSMVRVGKEVRSLNWLDGGFLAYTERDASGSLTRHIVNIVHLDDIQSVNKFNEDDIGGERHVRRPDGGWIYVATSFNRSHASDGYSVTNLLDDGARGSGSSKAYQIHPGEFIAAVNFRSGDSNFLKLIQLTEQIQK